MGLTELFLNEKVNLFTSLIEQSSKLILSYYSLGKFSNKISSE